MKSVFFSEPLIYVPLSLIILVFGVWLAFLTSSIIPILIVAVPLGWLIVNVAEEELAVGRKWFLLIVVACCVCGVWALLYDHNEILYSAIFVIILVSCSLYSRKANYKKRSRK